MMYSNIAAAPTGAAAVARTNRVLRNAYMLLGITLLPTIAGAFVGALFPLMAALGWMSLIVFLGAMFGLQALIIRNRDNVRGIGWLLLFTFVMGYFVGPMLGYAVGSFSNGIEMIALAVGGTAAIFFILAGYATVTKRNLASPSLFKMLFVGMWMFFIAGAVNFFFQVPALSLAISSVFMLIACGFILYTVNNVVRGGETNYIMVTMTLYIMLLNLFQSLMHLLMAFTGNRE